MISVRIRNERKNKPYKKPQNWLKIQKSGTFVNFLYFKQSIFRVRGRSQTWTWLWDAENVMSLINKSLLIKIEFHFLKKKCKKNDRLDMPTK